MAKKVVTFKINGKRYFVNKWYKSRDGEVVKALAFIRSYENHLEPTERRTYHSYILFRDSKKEIKLVRDRIWVDWFTETNKPKKKSKKKKNVIELPSVETKEEKSPMDVEVDFSELFNCNDCGNTISLDDCETIPGHSGLYHFCNILCSDEWIKSIPQDINGNHNY